MKSVAQEGANENAKISGTSLIELMKHSQIFDVSSQICLPLLEDMERWLGELGYKTVAKDEQLLRLLLHDEPSELEFEFLVVPKTTLETRNIVCIEWKFVLDNMFGGKCGFIITTGRSQKELKTQISLGKEIVCPESVWFQKTVESRLQSLADDIVELVQDKIRQREERKLKSDRQKTYGKLLLLSIVVAFVSVATKTKLFFKSPRINLSVEELESTQRRALEKSHEQTEVQTREIRRALGELKNAIN